jgi:hypothetical protein
MMERIAEASPGFKAGLDRDNVVAACAIAAPPRDDR